MVMKLLGPNVAKNAQSSVPAEEVIVDGREANPGCRGVPGRWNQRLSKLEDEQDENERDYS